MTSVDNNTSIAFGSDEAAPRAAWVKPAIESFEPVSATESITSTNPGDIINSNS
jgi:hypothetical protein